MTLRSGFYNSIGSDREYYADDMNMPYKKIITNGVIPVPSSSLQVMARSGLTVTVKPGNGLFADKWLENDADIVLTHEAAHATLARIDLVVVRVNENESVRNTSIVIIKGTPASNPVAPSYNRTTYINDYVLAQVKINAGATSITQTNITDTRPNNTMCGWCTSLIEQVDTTTLFNQWQTAGEEAQEENQAAFNAWFQNVKETLSTATLIRQYVNRYNVQTNGQKVIPIGISQYNANLDILEVYINGFNAIPTVDYTVTGNTSITLTNAVNSGAYVVFKVFKSVDGSDAETVVSQVVELQNKVNALEDNVYYCNGYNDNADLITFIDEWLATSPTKHKIEVVGQFANNSSYFSASDGNSYNFVYELAEDKKLVLDFTKCEIINADTNFMYLKNVEAVNCSVKFNASAAVIGFGGSNAKYDGCEVLGTINGTTSYGFKGDGLVLNNCNVNVSNSGAIYGVDLTNGLIEGSKIYVKSAGGSAYGASLATESRAVNCDFEGETAATETTTSGNGGIGGGYFSNCKFIGAGGIKGHGFYVRAGYFLDAANCIFRGYTKQSTGYGAGLAAANDSGNTYILNGINCNQVSKTGYTQTNSMDMPSGYGVVSGCFYSGMTANENITQIAAYNRNRI